MAREGTAGKDDRFLAQGDALHCNERLALHTVLKISSALFEASGIVTNSREEIWDGHKCYAVGVSFLAVRFAASRGTFLSTSV